MKIINIHNSKRTIYLFCRNDKGDLEIYEKYDFFPYFYDVHPEGNFTSFDKKMLKKIFVSIPSNVPEIRKKDSYEADVLFVKRYLIDRVNKLEKCPIKYAFIDIEILSDELPNVQEASHTISCISIYNSLYKNIQSFYLGNYQTEYHLIEDFITYMQKESFDLWLSWNVNFDYNYLYNRIPDFATRISPVRQTRYGTEDVYYPAGISIIDYLSWFKKITLNRAKSYSLDNIAQEYLNEKSYGKIDFNILSKKILEKNINDINRMIKLEDKFKLISYFDEIRRLSKVEWEDLLWNSRIIDMLLLNEAKKQNIILPMKPKENEKEEFEGAYREAYELGAHWGITKYDLSSAYPFAIIDFCLDPSNITNSDDSLSINSTYFIQNDKALLPTIVRQLINLKNEIKFQLENTSLESSEHKDIKIKYNAIKSIVNSAYGVMGNRFFRLYDKRVASATTYLIRDLLKYVKEKIEKKGYKVIYVDTDSIFINSKNNLTDSLNEIVQEWAKKKGKEKINIEFAYEGIFERLLILAKCRYVGYLKTEKGIEKEVKGVEIKRKDSTEFLKKFQEDLIEQILNKYEKNNIIRWVESQKSIIKILPLEQIAFPCKLSKKPEEYKNTPIFVRALEYSGLDKKVGDTFYYIYVKSNDTDISIITEIYNDKELLEKREGNIPKKEIEEEYKNNIKINKLRVLHKKIKIVHDVMAFDEDHKDHVKNIDWDLMIQRNIDNKKDVVFEAMGW